jgi:hypothetical protein
VAEQEFTAINSSNAQLSQTVDGRTAVLVYNQMSVGSASVTALQYRHRGAGRADLLRHAGHPDAGTVHAGLLPAPAPTSRS